MNIVIERYEEMNYEFKNRADQLENCDFIKVILMLLVVIYHSAALWLNSGWFGKPVESNSFLDLLATWLNSFHIYGFALVSGYLFYYLKFEKGKYRYKGLFILTKAKRLLVPYVFVAIIWIIPWQCFYFNTKAIELVKKYVLAINPSQLWFLWMLFWVFVISIIIPEKVYRNWKNLSIVACGLYIIGFLCGTFCSNVFQIFTACQYFIFFALGVLLREYKESCIFLRIPSYVWIVLDLLLFVVSTFVVSKTGIIFKIVRIVIALLLHIIGSIMAFTVLNSIANMINWKENKIFSFLKKHNFTIYLFHQQVIYGTITLLNGKVKSVVLLVLNFVAAIMISSLISIILHKWKLTRFLIGEKV